MYAIGQAKVAQLLAHQLAVPEIQVQTRLGKLSMSTFSE